MSGFSTLQTFVDMQATLRSEPTKVATALAINRAVAQPSGVWVDLWGKELFPRFLELISFKINMRWALGLHILAVMSGIMIYDTMVAFGV
jgi:hypothetical protein